MNQTELFYTLSLLRIPGIGSMLARKLIERMGSAEAVFTAPKGILGRTPGIGTLLADTVYKFKDFKETERELKRVEQHQLKLFHYASDDFPQRLKQAPDHPLLLFGKGKLPVNSNRMVAVVGTRAATDYGRHLTEELVAGMQALNITVVSGLAYGIDVLAHRAALKVDLPTIGVLGHGLGRIYPAAHRQTAAQMLEKGGLLTEFPYEAGPDKENFPKRNRIVAGMVDAVIVVEAANNGGALITAGLANDYNRDVFAFPGRVTDKYSAGCHALVRQHKAALVGDSTDFLEAMGWINRKLTIPQQQPSLFPELDAEEQQIFDLIKAQTQLGIDGLCLNSGISTARLSNILLGLEFKGLVRSLPGKQYAAV